MMTKMGILLSHAAIRMTAAVSGAFVTYSFMTGQVDRLVLSAAHAQDTGTRSTEIIAQAMADIAREMRISMTKRVPGNGSTRDLIDACKRAGS
jgi:hypothetical protein